MVVSKNLEQQEEQLYEQTVNVEHTVREKFTKNQDRKENYFWGQNRIERKEEIKQKLMFYFL